MERWLKEADETRRENEKYFLECNGKPFGANLRDLEVIQNVLGHYADRWPQWHPMAAICGEQFNNVSDLAGYVSINGPDHTRLGAKGFITCPYGPRDEMIEHLLSRIHRVKFGGSDEKFSRYSMRPWFYEVTNAACFHVSYVTRELVEFLAEYPGYTEFDEPPVAHTVDDIEEGGGLVRFYAPDAWPVMAWFTPAAENQVDEDMNMTAAVAMPLMLARTMLDKPMAQVAESWNDMRPYNLGLPHGATSSPIVTNDTGKLLKRAYTAIMDSGAFGEYYGE